MIRKFKVMGLAVVAVLAVSAVAASAAQAAAGFNYPEGSTLTAEQASTGGEQVFTTKWGTVKCEKVSGGAKTTGTSATSITSENISYHDNGKTTCRAPFGTSATIEMHTCMYTFNYTATATEGITGNADLKCGTSGDHITINAPGCVITVAEQSALGPVNYKSSGGVVTIEPHVTNIHSTASGFLCSGSDESGTYSGNVTVTGSAGGLSVE